MNENSITDRFRRRWAIAFFLSIVLLLVWPSKISFAQKPYPSAHRITHTTMLAQKVEQQLASLDISASETAELAGKIKQFNEKYKTSNWLKSTLYFVDLSSLDFDTSEQYIAIFDYANTDYLQVFSPNQDGTHRSITLGDELALDLSQARYRLPTIKLNPRGPIPKYLIIQAVDTIKVKFDVLIDSRAAFDKRVQSSQRNYGLFFGVIITLSIYSLILFFVTRERSYFWYSSYLFFMVLLLITNNGLGQYLIWPAANGLTTKIGFMSVGGLILTMSMFVSSFLDLKTGFHSNNLISRVVMLATVICLISSLWLHHGVTDYWYFGLASVQMINILAVSYIAFKQQQIASIYLFLGYLTLFPAIAITISKFTGLLGSSYFTNHAIEASLLIEAFVLSIGVGEKIRQIKIKQFLAVDELRNSKQKFLSTLINVREREKKEFGVVLHNSVVQNLAVLRTKLDPTSDSWDSERTSFIEVIDNTIDEVREISHQSYPYILETFGLAEAAKNYAEKNLDAREIDWICDIDDNRLNKDQLLTLYRIIQESINNTYRHADASKVSIRLYFLDGDHYLEIQDDGCGFETDKEGFGLSLIKQYALHLGGAYEIISAPNSGAVTIIKF